MHVAAAVFRLQGASRASPAAGLITRRRRFCFQIVGYIMETIVATLLSLAGSAILWGLYLAYRAGLILASVLQELRAHDRRITALERGRVVSRSTGPATCP